MKPHLVFHCQHSLGIGHLVRSLAIAEPLSEHFDVTFLNGGTWPDGFRRPSTIRLVDLPPLRMDDNAGLVAAQPGASLEGVKAARLAAVCRTIAMERPSVAVIELYPFGRKKLAFEIEPLIEATRAAGGKVVCSVRDLLVQSRRDQQAHDDRAAATLNRAFDLVVVHTDPTFARLEESFRPSTPVGTPIVYSGLVAPVRPAAPPEVRDRRIIVSAGSGAVGGALYRACLNAAPAIRAQTNLAMLIVAGPFLDEAEWRALEAETGSRNVKAMRWSPDVFTLLHESEMSISQCGYNTVLDLLQSGVKSLVVPFVRTGEDEQTERARRLEALGLVTVLEPAQLTPAALTNAVVRLNHETCPRERASLDLGGAAKTVRLIVECAAAPREFVKRRVSR